jgi:hypothetical protein
MDLNLLKQQSPFEWHIPPFGAMRVPGVIYTNEMLIRDMDMKVYEQVTNVATLPGIVRASYAMPDAHWGYGFPIGGVAPSILMSGASYLLVVSASTSPAGSDYSELGSRSRISSR